MDIAMNWLPATSVIGSSQPVTPTMLSSETYTAIVPRIAQIIGNTFSSLYMVVFPFQFQLWV